MQQRSVQLFIWVFYRLEFQWNSFLTRAQVLWWDEVCVFERQVFYSFFFILGKSQPFGKTANSYSLENLKYLTADQALDDLASFIQFAKSTNLFGITPNMPWVTIGGSYPGALSAWFR